MVDPEHLRLVEDLARDAVELARARQVVPDRLLDHDPRLSWRPASPIRWTIVGNGRGGVAQ